MTQSTEILHIQNEKLEKKTRVSGVPGRVASLRIVSVPAFQCYMFHMYVGVRAGGGIGDEIEDPAGDEYEIYRIIFDITFFFFVIVILLAIIQGKPHPAVALGHLILTLSHVLLKPTMQGGLTV